MDACRTRGRPAPLVPAALNRAAALILLGWSLVPAHAQSEPVAVSTAPLRDVVVVPSYSRLRLLRGLDDDLDALLTEPPAIVKPWRDAIRRLQAQFGSGTSSERGMASRDEWGTS